MSTITTARDKFKFTNTLVCLLKAIEGVETTVELRNENAVRGRIIFVDARMHLTMENVVFKPAKGAEQTFTDFFVKGHNIRFVHIPDHIDIRKAMERQLSARQSVYTNISKAKAIRQQQKQKFAERRERKEILRLKREASLSLKEQPKTD